MKLNLRTIFFTLSLLLLATAALADDYSDTKKLFENAGASDMFKSA